MIPKGMTAGEQLDKLGIKSSDIDYVVISHLDCDHADVLRQFKDAMVARSEYERSISIFVLRKNGGMVWI